MSLVRLVLFCLGLRSLGGPGVLAFTLVCGGLMAALLFGSMVTMIARTRGPVRPAMEHRRQQQEPETRDWNRVREEQLRQLGLDRQGKRR